jgi:hypothetical protein
MDAQASTPFVPVAGTQSFRPWPLDSRSGGHERKATASVEMNKTYNDPTKEESNGQQAR